MPKPLLFAACLLAEIWMTSVSLSAADSELPRFAFEDWLLAPVRVHLLSASNAPAIQTTLTEADVERILKKMNGIWSQAGITFWRESLVREAAANPDYAAKMGEPDDLRGLLTLRPVVSRATNLFHIYYVKQFSANGVYLGAAMFVKDSASLRTVPGGIDEPLPRVSSHELGHALTLPHCTNAAHLMFRGTTGTNLNTVEIQQARDAAMKLPWIERASEVFMRAEALERRNDSAGARGLYARIAVMPLEERHVQQARQRR